MKKYSEKSMAVIAVVDNYFKGIFEGDTSLLRKAFHPQALVTGDVDGQPYFKTVDQYIEGVGNRKSPQELNQMFQMEILSLEIINSIAIVKARLPMFEFNYYDLLSLNLVNGEWVIMNKLLTNVK